MEITSEFNQMAAKFGKFLRPTRTRTFLTGPSRTSLVERFQSSFSVGFLRSESVETRLPGIQLAGRLAC